MWKDKLKEVIYILENSDINEIEIRFWFRKIKVTKKPPIINSDISNLSPNIVNNFLYSFEMSSNLPFSNNLPKKPLTDPDNNTTPSMLLNNSFISK